MTTLALQHGAYAWTTPIKVGYPPSKPSIISPMETPSSCKGVFANARYTKSLPDQNKQNTRGRGNHAQDNTSQKRNE
jgi:hypothetical protein